MIRDDISIVDPFKRRLKSHISLRSLPLSSQNMSLVARSKRTAARTISRTRPYSLVVDAPSAEWVAKREAIKHHASGTFVSLRPKSPN
jgi:hypothetical protein